MFREALKQKTIGCMLTAGVVITVVSFFLMWLFASAGVFRGTYTREPVTNKITDAGTMNLVPVTFVFFALGIALIFGSVGYGLYLVKHEHEGPRNVMENFRILARYAYDRHHNYMQDEYMIESSEGVRFYVRAVTPFGESLEFETSEAMWLQCGEGMYGEAELQGKWIGRFTPYVGTPADPSERSEG